MEEAKKLRTSMLHVPNLNPLPGTGSETCSTGGAFAARQRSRSPCPREVCGSGSLKASVDDSGRSEVADESDVFRSRVSRVLAVARIRETL